MGAMAAKDARERRVVDGVLLLDKPVGRSSNAALQRVKYLYRARKAGHTGSLDPLASGLLPIGFGAATRFAGLLLDADKRYRFTCRLGITTATGDAEGQLLQERPVGSLEPAAVAAVLTRFVGTIQQIPPMYSALKQGGERLYRLARRGQVVERPPRTVQIHELRLLRLEGEYLDCEVHCSKGTYVRTLAEDIGAALGCGAHVAALRRTGVTPFDAARMVSLDAIEERAQQGLAALDALLLPVDAAVAAWPAVQVSDEMRRHLLQGLATALSQTPTRGWVRLYTGERFLGTGEVHEDGRLAPRQLLRETVSR
jgi:tRNA pseudouridine55 synthase